MNQSQQTKSRTNVNGKRARKIGLPKGRIVDPSSRAEIKKLLAGKSIERQYLIEHLHLIQDKYNQVPAPLLAALAEEMKLSQSEVYEVATFYHHFAVVKDNQPARPPLTIRVCDGIACELAGANKLFRNLENSQKPGFEIICAPCVGACHRAPVAVVGKNQIWEADPATVSKAIAEEKVNGRSTSHQTLNEYRENGGYAVLNEILDGNLDREQVLSQLEKSGVRGMGGAGFPVHKKWRFLEGTAAPRAVVVNADEGEPGTFKDRHCMETEPHKVLEGMLIAANVIGASDAYIYLRDEYPHIHQMLRTELSKLAKTDLVGDVQIHLRRGAGAYICGEESALLESIEGKRGLPRNRPPYPAQSGVFGRPTLINNVETLYWVSEILKNGPDWYADEGHPRFYSVSGRVKKPGVVRARSNITVEQLIEEFCGGMLDGHIFKAYLPGGASGGILPATMSNIALDFGTLEEFGCFIGSAAVVVFSDQDRIPDVSLNLLKFFANESCGQCTPCRLGCEKMVALLTDATLDERLLSELSTVMRDASICGLGQAAPNPVTTGMVHFRDEFE